MTESKHVHSAHYLGTQGEEYFRWQRVQGDVGGVITAKSFQNHIREQDCVLDFGCGGGFVLKHLSCGQRIGVEINPAARLTAKQNGIDCYSCLSELNGPIADVVISNHALEHIPSPVETLAEINSLIKPKGLLILKLPIDDWRTQRRINPSDINHHLYTWTPQLLFNCLTEAGFDKSHIQVNIYTHAWFPGYAKAYRVLPETIFDLGCGMFAFLKKRRQLIAIARKRQVQDSDQPQAVYPN
jgi:SAM-dependent methyltransferase